LRSDIQLKHSTGHCLSVFWSAAQPRKSLTVSEWADTHRELSGKQAGERGRYRTSRTPFLQEIMDCFSSYSRVSDLIVMKSSQVGVTEATVNVIGYKMDHAPGPMMVILPTLDSRDKWKTQKLNPLLQDTPVIKELLGGLRSRDAANSKDMIDFPGGVLFLAGGNSPNSYAQSTVSTIILDDFDRFPAEIGDEGDVETLADGRTKAMARAIRCKISTPTLKDKSLIWRAYQDSDQRKYHVPCPHCGEYQPLEWGGKDKGYGIKWNHDISQAWYLCRECAAEIYDHHKPDMLRQGRWVAANPSHKVRGYHISALYAPIGLGPSWLDLALQFRAAQQDSGKLQVFINTQLGEPWEQITEGADPSALLMRCEEYEDDLPVGARTVGVDVQKDRLEISVYDWGVDEESWSVEHEIIEGDTAGDAPWEELDEVLKAYAPDAAGIDTGYNTDKAKEFCEHRRWAFPIKGIEGKGKPLTEDEAARKRRLRHRKKKGFSPHLVSDYAAMALLAQRLALEKPGPGYMHFAKLACFDEEFFAQLTSNRLEERKVRGVRILVWRQVRVRNETYDTWKMALAALRLAKIDLKARVAARARRIDEPVSSGKISLSDFGRNGGDSDRG
jgi:phage terminase large subunit GpA-like protein